MKKLSVGIDVGFKGAMVAIDEDRKIIEWADTPTIPLTSSKQDYDAHAMLSWLENLRDMAFPDLVDLDVTIEQQLTMPSQYPQTSFKCGRGVGLWEGIALCVMGTYNTVLARTWQKEMLKGVPKGDTKNRALWKAHQLFPELPLKSSKRAKKLNMDGRADAALIALWGLKHG